MGQQLFVSTNEVNPPPQGWLWLKPVTDGVEVLIFDDGEWVQKSKISLSTHSHSTHGDINFTGTVSADGDAGITGVKTLGGFRFTFKKGLLVGFEPV